MKRSAIIGTVILIIMTISVVYLVSYTNLLLPAKFKDRYSTVTTTPDQVEQQQVLNQQQFDNNEYVNEQINNIQPFILPDSLIPKTVRWIITNLEENGIKILTISSSKWNLFGEQGVWVNTSLGVIDIIPVSKQINTKKIKIIEVKSDSPKFHSYEIYYEGKLIQIQQGKETYFTVGKDFITKSFSNELSTISSTIEKNKD